MIIAKLMKQQGKQKNYWRNNMNISAGKQDRQFALGITIMWWEYFYISIDLGFFWIGFSCEKETCVKKYNFKTDRITFKKKVLEKILTFLEEKYNSQYRFNQLSFIQIN